MMHLEADVFTKFDKQWALVTAGTPEHYNTMTISWGGLGTLWERPVATVYVKKNRYTFAFMEESDYFTVSFYPEEQRRALSLLGSTSGRDGDKVAAAGLTPEFLPQGITFRPWSAARSIARTWTWSRSPRRSGTPFIRTSPSIVCISAKWWRSSRGKGGTRAGAARKKRLFILRRLRYNRCQFLSKE